MNNRTSWQTFCTDYLRMTGVPLNSFFLGIFNILFRHNVRFALYYRLRASHHRLFAAFGKCGLYRLSRKYGLEFSPHSTIGEGLFLGHPYNITVGDSVVIGKCANLHKGCTIGVENRGSRAGGGAIIGDCVWIGINATIVGKVRIGDDVLIAPNTYVNFDVPSHSVVVGNPGIIHHRDNATECYINTFDIIGD